MKTLLPFLFCLFTLNNFAQQITNVRSAQEGKQVVVTYDITGGNSTDKLDVTLWYNQNNSEFKQATLGLTGDIGPGITPGTNKTIRWSPLKELNKLTGTGFSFKVKAVPQTSNKFSGVYFIENVATQKYLDLPNANTERGIELIQFGFNGNSNQQWKIKPTGDGYYCIVSVSSGKCLDVPNASNEDGATIIQWDCTEANNQKWNIIKERNSYVIISKSSLKCLDIPNSNANDLVNVKQYSCNGGANQSWIFKPVKKE